MSGALAQVARRLVITGGTSGIGEAIVRLAAARRYDIVFAGSRAEGAVHGDLARLGLYLETHVEKPRSVGDLRNRALAHFGLGGTSKPLLVVASAGVSRRGSPEAVAEMEAINVGGTRALMDRFGPIMNWDRGDRFVGVGSIVAAEGIAIPGDEAYQGTKRAIQDLMGEAGDRPGQNAVPTMTLVPGAVDTPMTRQDLVFGLMIAALARVVSAPAAPLRGALATFLQTETIGSAPGEVLRTILGNEIFEAADLRVARATIDQDPGLTGRAALVVPKAVVQYAPARDRAIEILRGLDMVIGPGLVAERLLDTWEAGPSAVSRGAALKVYSVSHRKEPRKAPILGLLPHLAPAKPAAAGSPT